MQKNTKTDIFVDRMQTPLKATDNLIAKRLASINEDIDGLCKKTGRDPAGVTLVAVSKTYSVEHIREAYDAGHRHFGENRVQELVPKMQALPDDIVWHMIGTLQSNKVRLMAERVNCIQSVVKTSHLKEIEKRAALHQRTISVMLQVNISQEDQKSGCEPEELPALLDYAAQLSHVRVDGLMGLGELTANRERIRQQFQQLYELREQHRDTSRNNVSLKHLSMGMSADYDMAIEEGATIIRIGSAIFGQRDYP